MKDRPKKKLRQDIDSPWKELLEEYFPQFISFYFPQIYEEIDWNCKPIFLNSELQKVVRDAKSSRRFADKLVKVRCKSTGKNKSKVVKRIMKINLIG
ncbi:MAG: hypothetical protein HQK53_18055 [Oligoflexia bacterium]|nr:hypothetical protein [Oligoflexia bacterium]